MNIDEIKEKVRNDEYIYTLHAETERKADDLTFYQIEETVISGKILEQYSDTKIAMSKCRTLPIHTRINPHKVRTPEPGSRARGG